MPVRSVLPLVALVAGALVFTAKKAKASSSGNGSGGGGDVPHGPPHEREVAAHFTVRDGDLPGKVAFYYTGQSGRHGEMQLVSGPSATNIPAGAWFPGSVVLLPASWRPFSKPLPIPNSTSVPTSPPEFPAEVS